jgi:protein phosphatase 1 regulatory subunit 12A
MNLALQKRHEQLERWRQNEANAELQEQQAIESTRLQEKNQNASIKQSDEQLKSNYSKSKAVQNSISPFGDQSIGDERTNSDRKSRNSSSRSSRLLSSGKQQVASDQRSRQQVKFTDSTLFLNACANGDLDECKRLIEERLVDINVTTCDGLTGLHEAAICGNCEMVEYLLDNGANINCCDHEGWTPLHAAASLGQIDIVKLLLKRNADATIVNCENFLAYDLSRNDEVRELIGEHLNGLDIEQLRHQEELLIEQDIEKWIRTGHYEEKFHPVTQATVLHVLAAKGYTRLMKRILETPSLKKQINLEAKDSEGFTPLLAASFWDQTEIVELLIEHGANIFAQSDSGYKISSVVSRHTHTLLVFIFVFISLTITPYQSTSRVNEMAKSMSTGHTDR